MVVEPFVKWVGGKRQLLSILEERMPKKFGRYWEPFAGGSALFFHLLPHNAILNDKNAELMNAYKEIKNDPYNVIDYLEIYDERIRTGGKEFYYKTRNIFNQRKKQGKKDAEQAALFIFLNKHSFNGVYRENADGDFNIAYNNSTAGSFHEENLLLVYASLQDVELQCEDFSVMCGRAEKGDFVFLDSPYAPLNPTSFDSYIKEGFSLEDHIRVAAEFYKLTNRGVFCIVTNHNTELVRKLYKGCEIETLYVRRSVNSNALERTGEEVLIKNF